MDCAEGANGADAAGAGAGSERGAGVGEGCVDGSTMAPAVAFVSELESAAVELTFALSVLSAANVVISAALESEVASVDELAAADGVAPGAIEDSYSGSDWPSIGASESTTATVPGGAGGAGGAGGRGGGNAARRSISLRA